MRALELAGPLFDRTAELDALDGALTAAAGGAGRAVLIEGAPGTGKSALLAAAGQRAQALGLAVLVAHGSPLERDVPFGLVVELFGGAVSEDPAVELDGLFRGAGRLAAPLFSLRLVPVDEADADPAYPTDPPLVQGLYWAAVNLARRNAVLVAVDDAHWSDPHSLRFLAYLAERAGGLPVALVVALDPGEIAAAEQPIRHLRAAPKARVLRTRPLTLAGVAALTRQFYFPDAPEEFCRAVADASGGNPFVTHELLRLADLDGVPPTAASAERVQRMVPDSVVRANRARLARLGGEASRLAEVVSVLGAGSHLRHAARLAELDADTAAAAADRLIAAGVLAHLEPLEFMEPSVRAAVYASVEPGRRGLLHRRAAAVLQDDGAEPDELAPHLLATTPAGNSSVADTLRLAARRAVAAGHPTTALMYLRRALAEPPSVPERAGFLVELGRIAATVGDPDAIKHLRRAVEVGPSDLPVRAEALYETGRTLVGGGRPDEAAEYLDRALEEGGATPSPELRLRVMAAQLQASRLRGRRERGLVADAEALLHRPGPAGPGRHSASVAEPALVGQLAMEWLLAGRRFDEVRAAASRAVTDMEATPADEPGLLFYDAVAALAWADDLDGAEKTLQRAETRAQRQGLVIDVATARFRRAMVSYLRGAVGAAVEDGQSALDAATPGWEVYLPAARGILALALVEMAELDRAAAVLGGDEQPEDSSSSLPEAIWHQARATLLLVRGEPAPALLEALAAGRILTENLRSPSPLVPWRSSAAAAHFQLDASAEARRLAAEEVQRARAFGAPRPLGVALRAEGSILGGSGGVARLREAVEVLAESPARLEYARALGELGAALRRRGQREAGDMLRQGLEEAEGCGAVLLCERLREEIRAGGVRMPRRGADRGTLTPAEERVAGLAASGLTNKEIAGRLYVSVGAVEFHLRNVYRKLGVASRRELPGALPPQD